MCLQGILRLLLSLNIVDSAKHPCGPLRITYVPRYNKCWHHLLASQMPFLHFSAYVLFGGPIWLLTSSVSDTILRLAENVDPTANYNIYYRVEITLCRYAERLVC